MKIKHTSGEWKVAMNGTQVWCDNVQTICRLDNTVKDEMEMKYNARLIAVAPEMLERLKAVRSWYENQNILRGNTPIVFSEILSTIKKATE